MTELDYELFAIRYVQRHANRPLQLAAGVAKRFHVASVGAALPFDMEGGWLAGDCAAMRRNRRETLV